MRYSLGVGQYFKYLMRYSSVCVMHFYILHDICKKDIFIISHLSEASQGKTSVSRRDILSLFLALSSPPSLLVHPYSSLSFLLVHRASSLACPSFLP